MRFTSHLKLAASLAVGHLGLQLMGLVDTIMLGRVSKAALAGAGIANSVLFLVLIFGVGLVMGLDSVIPRAVGAGRHRDARRILTMGLRFAAITTVPLTLLAALTPLALEASGMASDVHKEASEYVWGRLPGILPFLAFIAVRSYVQAYNKGRAIVLTVVAANVVNLVADAVLIFGDGALIEMGLPAMGLPALGSVGAAISTSLVNLASVGLLALAITRPPAVPAEERAQSAPPQPAIPGVLALGKLGLPIGLHLIAEVGAFSLAAVLAGRLGKVPAAAHQVAIMLAGSSFSVALGIGAATAVRVGHACGAGQLHAARRGGFAGIGMSIGFMGAAAVVFLIAAHPLARLLTTDPTVIDAAVPLLYIAALFQLSDGVQAVAAGALRGMGDNHSTAWANIVGHYALGVTTSIALGFGAGHGAQGLWWGLTIGLTAVAIALTIRFWWITRAASGKHTV